MCSLLSGTDQDPLAVNSFKWAPHPSFDASVKIAEDVLLGVMVGLEVHCLPLATIVSEGVGILVEG